LQSGCERTETRPKTGSRLSFEYFLEHGPDWNTAQTVH
jgi:hypothetical protein